MSSPVHYPEDLEPDLMYAPPRVRACRRAGTPTARQAAGRFGRGNDNADVQFEGDRAMLELRRRLSLDPEAVPVPPQLNKGIAIERIALRLCGVAALCAMIAWVLTSTMTPATTTPSMAKPNGNEPAVVAAVPESAAKTVKLVHVRTPAEEEPASATTLADPDNSIPPTPNVSAPTQKVDVAVIAAPSPPAPPALSAEPVEPAAAPALDKKEIAWLVERGKSYLVNGDIAAARLLLRRAADAGSAEAALALGSTFDPRVIARLGAIGVTSDPKEARKWYEKAAQLGSPAAPRQLAQLAGQNH